MNVEKPVHAEIRINLSYNFNMANELSDVSENYESLIKALF